MLEPVSDYDDQMQGIAAGVLTHDETHCKHGTFIGHWAGPDYMCFYCEMGVDPVDETGYDGDAAGGSQSSRTPLPSGATSSEAQR